MKIYIVIGCNDYEGGDWCSMRWFRSLEEGEKYGDKLVEDRLFDFYEIMEGSEGVKLD
jgi:hypothetical protein